MNNDGDAQVVHREKAAGGGGGHGGGHGGHGEGGEVGRIRLKV